MKFADLAYKHLENGGVLTTDAAQARLDERANQLSIGIAAHALAGVMIVSIVTRG